MMFAYKYDNGQTLCSISEEQNKNDRNLFKHKFAVAYNLK